MRIKVKMIDGAWVTSCAFDGTGVITNLKNFYKWNIKGEYACVENKEMMSLAYRLAGCNFNNALLLYKAYDDGLSDVD